MKRVLTLAVLTAALCAFSTPSLAADEKPKKGERKAPNAEEFFSKKDTDKDGKLSKAEFLAGMPEERAAKAGARFDKMDTNGDALLTIEEFKAAMEKARENRKPKDDAAN